MLLYNVLGYYAEITLYGLIVCMFTSLIMGAILSTVMMHKSNCTKSFAVTVALMPLVVCVIVLLVSDNFGAGLAIAGAFSLIRFRSTKGSAKEIIALFIGVGIGIACGSGYVLIAALFGAVAVGMYYAYTVLPIWNKQKDDLRYKIGISYDFINEEDDKEAQIIDLIRPYVIGYNIKKSDVSCGKNSKKIKMSVIVDFESEEKVNALFDALKYSDIGADFKLDSTKGATVSRL